MYYCVVQNGYCIQDVSEDYNQLKNEWDAKEIYDNIHGDMYIFTCDESVYHVVNIYGGQILYDIKDGNVSLDSYKYLYQNWDMEADFKDLILIYPKYEDGKYSMMADNGDDVTIGIFDDLNELLTDSYNQYGREIWMPLRNEIGFVINSKMVLE